MDRFRWLLPEMRASKDYVVAAVTTTLTRRAGGGPTMG